MDTLNAPELDHYELIPDPKEPEPECYYCGADLESTLRRNSDAGLQLLGLILRTNSREVA
jgi:hypothetical protein